MYLLPLKWEKKQLKKKNLYQQENFTKEEENLPVVVVSDEVKELGIIGEE